MENYKRVIIFQGIVSIILIFVFVLNSQLNYNSLSAKVDGLALTKADSHQYLILALKDSIRHAMSRLGCKEQWKLDSYSPAIAHASTYFQVPWRWVVAQIRQESNFNPTAKSYMDTKMKGDKAREFAWGLMQIKKSTAMEIARELEEDYVDGILFDGVTNIRWGTYYFGKKLLSYGHDVETAIRAYNSGDGAVSRGVSSNQHWEYVSDFYKIIAATDKSITKAKT